jgi:hypothetical protein
MNTPTETKRDYSISDDGMLQDSRTTHGEFVNDLATFQNFDADFSNTFATQWDAAINNAFNAPTDEQIIDSQIGLTSNVEEAMEACKAHFQAAKYFIEKAFPNKPTVWNQFGFDNYDTARRTPEKMIIFMGVFFKVASKPENALLLTQAGYKQTSIDEIENKLNGLITAKTEQEMAKNERGDSTQNRVELFNKVWEFRTKVAKAAKNIFIDNYARYKVYLLPASAENSSSFSITGIVTIEGSQTPIENVQITTANNEQNTRTDSNGKYGLTKLAKGNYVITFAHPIFKTKVQTVDYQGGTLILNVQL